MSRANRRELLYRLQKPVIYLYPPEEKSIKVSLSLNKGSEIISQYPRMTDGTWHVKGCPDGRIFDVASGKEYAYLFWEAQRENPYRIASESAFCVASHEAEGFLESSLELLGLTARERNDFIVFWLPRLERNRFNLVQFLGEEYTNQAILSISPEPDTLIRVFMIFKRIGQKLVTVPKLEPGLPRRGFTVVEWGGMDLDEREVFFS